MWPHIYATWCCKFGNFGWILKKKTKLKLLEAREPMGKIKWLKASFYQTSFPKEIWTRDSILTYFFIPSGQDVSGVLESAVVDTSILEQYLSNETDPTLWVLSNIPSKIISSKVYLTSSKWQVATEKWLFVFFSMFFSFLSMLPESPPDSGSERSSPPQIPGEVFSEPKSQTQSSYIAACSH